MPGTENQDTERVVRKKEIQNCTRGRKSTGSPKEEVSREVGRTLVGSLLRFPRE